MNGLRDLAELIALSALVTALAMTCSSCSRTEYVTVESVRTDTLRTVRQRTDTLVVWDSTVVRPVGDTVYTDRWHTVYRVSARADTVYRSRTDTIPVPYEVAKTVEAARPLTWWQRTQIYGFRVIAAAALLYLGWRHRKGIVSLVGGILSKT